MELGRQQYQSPSNLHVRALELETNRDIRLKELEIEQKTGQTRHPSSPGLQGNTTPVPALISSPLPAASHISPVSKTDSIFSDKFR